MCMADRIKEKRIQAGLTQEELAEKLGLKKSAIAKYEKLGIPYRLEGVPMPTKEQVEFAKSILCK